MPGVVQRLGLAQSGKALARRPAGRIHVPDRNLWAAQQRLNPVGHGPQGRCGSGDERRQRCRTDVDAVKVGKYLRQTVVGDVSAGFEDSSP